MADLEKSAHVTSDGIDSPHLARSASPHRAGILERLCALEATLDRKLGIESQAIDRKLPESKQPVPWHQQLNMAFLWASSCLNLSGFATGFLGWELGLSPGQSITISILVSILGAALPGYCATFGPRSGLRQMSMSRFSFGWYPNKVLALLNVIQQVGFAAVGCITGGLALEAVADGHVSIAVGIIIIAVVSLGVGFAGLRAILSWERYAWIVFLVVFLIVFGMTGEYADMSAGATGSPATISGDLLSYIAIVYGSSASWAACASDYYVHYPATVSRAKVFLLTTLGIAIPTAIGLTAGCVVAAALDTQTEWADAYDEGLGYLIRDMLHPRGFAKFILVLFVLSGISNNIIGFYSAAISIQQLARPLARLPRVFWMIVVFAGTILIALIGRAHLNDYLEDFLSLLGYWCTCYALVILIEHSVFRKGDFNNYNLDGWNKPDCLPHGLAATFAILVAAVAWCMGMDETWFIGPIAGRIGEYGGDVANELTLLFTVLSYIPARYAELKYFGR